MPPGIPWNSQEEFVQISGARSLTSTVWEPVRQHRNNRPINNTSITLQVLTCVLLNVFERRGNGSSCCSR